jgi:hypothetical protein
MVMVVFGWGLVPSVVIGWLHFFFLMGAITAEAIRQKFCLEAKPTESTSIPEAFVWLCSSGGAFVRHAEIQSANLNPLRALGVYFLQLSLIGG